ncbi:hypothetical protein OSTOST_23558, partial [Ostertagia ostertagi]
MRCRLDNPDVLSVDTVHQLMISYRDNQNYNGMISLVEDLSRIEDCTLIDTQVIRYQYAFALARYRKAFEMSPLEHSGINLTTLLRASGEHFESNAEMQQI